MECENREYMVGRQEIHHGFRYFVEIDPREVCLGRDIVREKNDSIHSSRDALSDIVKVRLERALESWVFSGIVSYMDEMEREWL